MIRKFEPRRALEVMTPRYGSAYRIGGRLVLTAAHLLDDVGSMCRVRSKHSSDVEFDVENVKVVWKAQQADIALIELPDNITVSESVVFGKLPKYETGEFTFEMFGYPKWGRTQREHKTAAGGRQVKGMIYLADTSPDGLLVLEALRSPEGISNSGSDWEGNSGAAIVCEGLVIAVQQQHQNPNRPGSLEASPLWRIYGDEQWRDLLTQHGINPEPAIVGGKAICPYVGLSAFTEKEKDYFHGREEFSKELANKLLAKKDCLFVIGASGSGKSSVVQAGLLKELKLHKQVKFEIFSPRGKEKPQEMLTQALNNLGNCTKENLNIIFIDQFEELYALCHPDDQTEFVEKLKNLIEDFPSKHITLIIVARSDFYGYLLDSFKNTLLDNQVNVIPMNEAQIKSAISEPAKKVGLLIEPGLEERIIEELKVTYFSLPLLEFTLKKLWEKAENNLLTHKDYIDINGIKGALEEHANDALNELKNELKNESLEDLTRHVFTRLINYGLYDSPNTRRRAFPIEKLAFKYQENSKNDFKIITKIVTKFANKRLLVTDISNDHDKKSNVEIVHEFLIHGWEKLKKWTEQEGEDLRLLRKIEQEASDWTKKEKRKDDLLLKRSRLKTVEDLLKKENVTNEDEVDAYVKACKDRDEEEQVETEILLSTVTARGHSRENKNLDALTTLIKAGKRLQKLTNTDAISIDKKLPFLIIFGQILTEIAEKNSFDGHKYGITGVSCFSPDDQTIASSSDAQIIASSGIDKTVKLWSFDGNLLQTLEGHEDDVMDVSFSPDGEIIASASQDKTVKLWKKSTDAKTQWILYKTLAGHEKLVVGVSFSPDSSIIASASEDKTVRLWDKNGNLVNTFSDHTDGVINVAFSPDGKLIASASKDHTIKLWDLEKYELQSNSDEHFQEVSAVSFGLDNKTLISSGWDQLVMFWEIDENVPSLTHSKSKNHEAKVYYATFSPDGETIVAASEDGLITLWDKNGNSKITFKGHQNSVTKVSFSADSKTLVSGSLDGTIKIWDCTRKFDGHSSKISKIDFSSDGETIATASQDGIVKLWHRNGKLLSRFKYHDDMVLYTGIKFNPKRETIATASQNKIRIWNFEGDEMPHFSKHESEIRSISFNPEGTEIAVGYVDGTVILRNIDNGKHRTLAKHTEQVNMVTFSPQGTMIATASFDKTVKLCDLNGELLAHREYESRACYVSFSHDGGLIVTASLTKDNATQIELWNPNNNYQQILKGNSNRPVMSMGFIPDSNIVASISSDQSITLWNTADGSWLNTIEGNNSSSISAACIFSSQNDKSAIAVANSENRISLWSLSLEELLSNSSNQIRDYTKSVDQKLLPTSKISSL